MPAHTAATGQTFWGLDPGKHGAVAVLAYRGGRFSQPELYTLPNTPLQLYELLRTLRDTAVQHGHLMAFLEKVGGYIGEKQPGSSAFVFGQSYGWLEMALAALGVWHVLVTPQRWQKQFSLGTKSGAGGRAAWKAKLCAEAGRRFPGVDVRKNQADALLIAEYGRFYHSMILGPTSRSENHEPAEELPQAPARKRGR